MNTIYLYGIGGANANYRVIRYTPISQDEMSILTLNYEITKMTLRYPGIKRIFMIDNIPGLSRMVANSMKKNSIEECIVLVDYLEKNGLEIKV